MESWSSQRENIFTMSGKGHVAFIPYLREKDWFVCFDSDPFVWLVFNQRYMILGKKGHQGQKSDPAKQNKIGIFLPSMAFAWTDGGNVYVLLGVQ